MDGPTFWAAAGVIATVLIFGLTWLRDVHKERKVNAELSVEGASWVLERGNDYEEFLRLLLSLDHAALVGLTDSSAGSAELKAKVFEKSPETWSLVVFRDSLVVGYWSLFSLSPKLIKRLERGVMFDREIVESEIFSIEKEATHNFYVEMFGMHPAFRQSERRIFRMLLQSLNEFAIKLNRDGVRVGAVYAAGFSDKGASLCRRFGLTAIAKSDQGGDVYCTRDIGALFVKIEQLAGKRLPGTSQARIVDR